MHVRENNPGEENRRLQRTVRDLVALSTLPANWIGLGPEGIARNLVDVLFDTLSTDLLYIQLRGLKSEGLIEVVRTKDGSDPAIVDTVQASLQPILSSEEGAPTSTISDPFGDGKLHMAVTQLGFAEDLGVLIAGSRSNEFPTEHDRLLLDMVANQTAMVLQRMKAEEQLREQDERLRTTLASIGDAVITTDMNGCCVNLNTVAEALTGWTNSEATGQPLDVVFHIVNENTRQPVENPATQAFREGSVVGLDSNTILIGKDGTERAIDESATPICSKKGDVIGCVLVFRDVTQRRRLERENAKREEHSRFLAAIITSSNDAIISKTLDGIIQSWNAAAERIFGYTAEQAVGRHISMLIPAERIAEEDQIIAQLRAGQHVEHFDTVRLRSNGQSVYVSLTISPIRDAQGQIIGASKIARDITERMEAEERLRDSETRFVQLGNAISQLAWMAQPDGHIDWYNDRWYEYTGTTFEQMAGWGWQEVLEPDVLPQVIKQWRSALETGNSFDMTLPIRGADGKFQPFLTRVVPFRDTDGSIVRWFGTNTNISAIKRTEDELREARSRLESTLTAGEIGTWEFDPIKNVVRSDPNLARMFGVTPDEQERGDLASYLKAIHPDDKGWVTKSIAQALESEENYEAEYRIVGNDERIRWVVARGRVERDESGQAIRLPGVVVDITERKQVEKSLKISKEQLQVAMESAELGAWNIDPAANHLESDDRFRIIFHGSNAPLTYEAAFEALHPDDRDRIRDAVAAAIRPDNPSPYTEEYRVVHPNGAIRWVFGKGRANFEQTEAGRRLVSFDGTVMDITEQRELREELQELATRLQFVLKTAQIGEWALNLVTGTAHRSLTHDKCFGYDELLPEWSYEIFLSHVHPEDKEVVDHKFHQAMKDQSDWDFECRVIWPDQTIHWIEGHGSHYQTAISNESSMLGTVKDISDRKKQENQLRDLAVRLSEADRRKDDFLATLAHELRNPLAPIRTGLEVMKLSKDDPDTIEEIRCTMERQTQQLIMLVDDLLDVSRITKGKLELRKCRVELADVVQSAVEASRPFVSESNHKLIVNIPQEPIYLDADPNRLTQVLSNLLNNSTKYTPEGGRIRLSAERQNNDVVISVEDNGLGIPSQMLDRIFEMFTQIDRPQEKGYTGLGIGLSLVKSLVEMHDGKIEVHSEGSGNGSLFRVRLPILLERNDEKPIADQNEGPTSPKTKRKVLVVDDNKAAATMLGMVVKMLGNEVRKAHDGEEGIEVAEEFMPDVIFMDIGMPKMNGYEAARHIRLQPWSNGMTLIALTGWGQEEDKLKTKEAGFDYHLVKPAEPATIQELLDNSMTETNR